MDITKLKLYHYPATRSARVKWVLHELVGDVFETEIVSLYEGGQYSTTYLKKNPNHCVPTLELTLADGFQNDLPLSVPSLTPRILVSSDGWQLLVRQIPTHSN